MISEKQYKAICENIISEIIDNNNEKLLLTEMAPVVDYDKRDPFMITLNPRDSKTGDVFYFKLHNGKNYNEAESLCRISILDAKYEPWHSTPGKVELTLNSKGKKWLVKKLAKYNKDNPDMTNLEYIISYLNDRNDKQISIDSIQPEDYYTLSR